MRQGIRGCALVGRRALRDRRLTAWRRTHLSALAAAAVISGVACSGAGAVTLRDPVGLIPKGTVLTMSSNDLHVKWEGKSILQCETAGVGVEVTRNTKGTADLVPVSASFSGCLDTYYGIPVYESVVRLPGLYALKKGGAFLEYETGAFKTVLPALSSECVFSGPRRHKKARLGIATIGPHGSPQPLETPVVLPQEKESVQPGTCNFAEGYVQESNWTFADANGTVLAEE